MLKDVEQKDDAFRYREKLSLEVRDGGLPHRCGLRPLRDVPNVDIGAIKEFFSIALHNVMITDPMPKDRNRKTCHINKAGYNSR